MTRRIKKKHLSQPFVWELSQGQLRDLMKPTVHFVSKQGREALSTCYKL